MTLAPDAVQNVEALLLTGGYKSKIPLFHNVFHVGVEMCSHHRMTLITQMNKKKPPVWAAFQKNNVNNRCLKTYPATSSSSF